MPRGVGWHRAAIDPSNGAKSFADFALLLTSASIFARAFGVAVASFPIQIKVGDTKLPYLLDYLRVFGRIYATSVVFTCTQSYLRLLSRISVFSVVFTRKLWRNYVY